MNEKVLHTLEFDKIKEMLAGMAGTEAAKRRCRELEPYTDIKKIRQLQQETADSLSRIYKSGSIGFHGIPDITDSMRRLEIGGVLGIRELMNVGSVLRNSKAVKKYGDSELTDSLTSKFEALDPVTSLENEITRCIISEEEIADDASSGLKNVRRQIKITGDKVRETLTKVLNSSGEMLRDNLITTRNGRYCLPVKQEYKNSFGGMVHDQSATGSTVFMEPEAVIRLNNELAELAAKEKEEIEKVLANLSNMAGEVLETIECDYKVLVELDFVFARGNLAKKMKATEPIFNENHYINIKKGRHPLIEQHKVVPIDVFLGYKPEGLTESLKVAGTAALGKDNRADSKKNKKSGTPEIPEKVSTESLELGYIEGAVNNGFDMLVITGPNTGGKTVTLKTLGLMTIMGQAGLHIPAFEGSSLGIFEEVYADIGDEQSIEQSLSTFSSHMTNTVKILSRADENSLVLFDELGAGTDPIEGAALAMSILTHLHNKGITTAATTHYSELKIFALNTEGVSNGSCEFNVETLQPTYKLLIGIPGKSNAFAISRKLGLSDEIIEEAKGFIKERDESFEDIISRLNADRQKIASEKEELERSLAAQKELEKQLREKNEKLDKQKADILRKADEKARDILQKAKDYADSSIRTMNKLQLNAGNAREMEEQRAKLRERLESTDKYISKNGKKAAKAAAPAHSATKDHEFVPGDEVHVISMNLDGKVLEKENAKGEIKVSMGILKMDVKRSDLELKKSAEKVKREEHQRDVSAGLRMAKSMSASPELNIIGQYTADAEHTVEGFIDDAFLAHLPNVTIIHGTGTGALKKMVWDILQRTKYVKSYRLGGMGEGDGGATIVEFKY